MDSRERVFLCLDYKNPDRVPIDYWATSEVNIKLREKYGFSTQEELLDYFGVDFRYIQGPVYIGPEQKIQPDGSKEDHFGVPRKLASYGSGNRAGVYSEVVKYPLEHANSVDEIESYTKWPKAEWFDYECVREQARIAKEKGKVVVFMGDRLNRCAQLKPAMYVRGPDQILMDTILNPSIAKTVFKRITEFYSEYARCTLEAAENNIDIFFTGDDFGTQTNTFLPVNTWRELLRDGFKQFIDVGHEYGCKIAHHTCGYISSLIPEFIDCGLDILNPVQPEVIGLDFLKIKQEFGHKISFHGGISIQKTLPYGTGEDIQNEVQDRFRTLAPGGGYIFCTAHNLQIDTSIKNIDMLFKAYQQFGQYN